MKNYIKPEVERIEFSIKEVVLTGSLDPDADIVTPSRPAGW